MKKPEKRKCKCNSPDCWNCNQNELDASYNEALEDYEKFLPSEKEIFSIAYKSLKKNPVCLKNISKAISERIGKCT